MDAAYANCPLDDPFITPEMDAMLMMLGVKEEVTDLERGRKPAETKNWEVTLVSNVEAQAAGSDFQRCSEID